MPVTNRFTGGHRPSNSSQLSSSSLNRSSSSTDLSLGTNRERNQLDRQGDRRVDSLLDKIQAEENSNVKHLITKSSTVVEKSQQEESTQYTNNSLFLNLLSLTSRSRGNTTTDNVSKESISGKAVEENLAEEKEGNSRVDTKQSKSGETGSENIPLVDEEEDSLQDHEEEDLISDEEQLEKDLDLLLTPHTPPENEENESNISSMYSSFSTFASPFPSPNRVTILKNGYNQDQNEIFNNFGNFLTPPTLDSSVSTGSENEQRINPIYSKKQSVSSSSSTPITRTNESMYQDGEEERDVEALLSTIVPKSVATKRCLSADTFSPKSNPKSYNGNQKAVQKIVAPQRNLTTLGYSQHQSQEKVIESLHPVLIDSTSNQSPPTIVRELSFKKSSVSSNSSWTLHKTSCSNLSSLNNNYNNVASYDNDKEKDKTFIANNTIPNCYDKLNDKLQGITDHFENLKEQIINSNTGIGNVGSLGKVSSVDNLSEGCLDCKNNTPISSSMYLMTKIGKNKQNYMKAQCKCKVKAFNYRKMKIKNSMRYLRSISFYLILPFFVVLLILLPSQPHPPTRSPKSGDLGISGSVKIFNSDSRRNMPMHSGITNIPTFGKIPLGFNPYNPSNFQKIHIILFPDTSDVLSSEKQYDQDIVEQELPRIQSGDDFETTNNSQEEKTSKPSLTDYKNNNSKVIPTSNQAEGIKKKSSDDAVSLVLGQDGKDMIANVASSNSISSSSTSYHYPNTDEMRYPMLNAVGLYDVNKHLQFNNRKFTIMINTFKRHDMLKDAIVHYGQCSDLVDSIHVTWSEVGTPVPNPTSQEDVDFFSPYIPVIYDQFETTSLNNRFIPPQDLVTDGIFAVDDDIRVSCEDLKLAFNTWQHAEESLVGFMPRTHISESGMSEEEYKEALKDMKQEELEKQITKSKSHTNPIMEGNKSELVNEKDSSNSESHLEKSKLYNSDFEPIDTFRYNGWWKVWWDGEYSMILTKAAFIHRKFLYAYTYDQDPAIREYVDKNRNCEDIAMQFLVSDISKKPPVYVRGALSDLGILNGISTKSWHKLGHMKSRGECLNDFVTLYDGHVPLIKTTVISGSGMSWLFNQPSTIFEYFSSDILHRGKSTSSIKKEQQGEEKEIMESLKLKDFDEKSRTVSDKKKRKEAMKMNRAQLDQSELESIHHMLTNLPGTPSAGLKLQTRIEGDATMIYKDGVPLGTGADLMNMEFASPAASRIILSSYGRPSTILKCF